MLLINTARLRKLLALSLYERDKLVNQWLFIITMATSSPRTAPTGPRLARHCTRTVRHYCRRSLRCDPQLHRQVFSASAIYCRDPRRIYASRIHQVVLRSVGSGLCLPRRPCPRRVHYDVALRSRLVLQLDGKVIQPRLLVVEPDIAVLVELPRSRYLSDCERA